MTQKATSPYLPPNDFVGTSDSLASSVLDSLILHVTSSLSTGASLLVTSFSFVSDTLVSFSFASDTLVSFSFSFSLHSSLCSKLDSLRFTELHNPYGFSVNGSSSSLGRTNR